MTPIDEPKFSSKIEKILLLQIADNQLRWKLQSTGEYKKILAKKRKINSQEMIESGKLTIKKRKKVPKYMNDLADQIIKGE
jgi:polyphosphate kinase